MRISDWSSDVCSSDLIELGVVEVDLGGAAGHVEPVFGADAPVLLVDGAEARDVGGDRFAIVVLLLEGHFGHLAVGLDVEAVDAEARSEEHTSELQSLMRRSYAVFCLKNKHSNTKTISNNTTHQRIKRHRK